MTIGYKVRDEKLRYDIKTEAAKLILSSGQKKVMGQTKFTYYHLGKAFEKQIKTIEEQLKK